MRIHVDKVDQTSFAKVIGIDTVASNATSVVEGSPGLDQLGVTTLLLLEREGCGTLQVSGQGRVIVSSITVDGESQPGVIQSDSAGSTTSFRSGLECSTKGGGNPRQATMRTDT